MELDYKALAAGLITAAVFAVAAHAKPADKPSDQQKASDVVSVKDGVTVR
jgi:hypothetical protein